MRLQVKTIKATSRASVKIGGDSFYTFEYGEECEVPENITAEELREEKEKLWDKLNAEVDNQISEVYNFLHKKK